MTRTIESYEELKLELAAEHGDATGAPSKRWHFHRRSTKWTTYNDEEDYGECYSWWEVTHGYTAAKFMNHRRHEYLVEEFIRGSFREAMKEADRKDKINER